MTKKDTPKATEQASTAKSAYVNISGRMLPLPDGTDWLSLETAKLTQEEAASYLSYGQASLKREPTPVEPQAPLTDATAADALLRDKAVNK